MGWLSFWSTKPTDHGEKAEGKPTTRGSEPSQYSDAVLQPTRADGSSQPCSSGPSDWRRFGELSTVVPTIILTTVSIGTYGFYRSYLRRIPAADHISPAFFRRRSIFGKVTSVGDGDNFRIYHTPGGRLAGWGLWRRVPEDKKELQHQTIHVRLAGIDAPELAHFGRPAQPFSQEALDWLTKYVLHRRVRAYVYRRDQYERVVASVYTWKGLFRRNVGLEMLKTGLATVYEAKSGAEFGDGQEERYRRTESSAKSSRRGMWALDSKKLESPRDYKTRMAERNSGEGKPVGKISRLLRYLSPKR